LPNQVPIRISPEHIERKHSIAESIASLLVFGLFWSGTFSTLIDILPNFPFASI
jgi:hypothetical protein